MSQMYIGRDGENNWKTDMRKIKIKEKQYGNF